MEGWRTQGYSTIRAAGSHGLYDIISFRPDRPVEMIQCKVVATKATGNRMLETFKKEAIPSKYYHQTMFIKIKGTSNTLTTTV